MKKVYTAKDVEALLASGKSAADLPANVILTPSAKDVLNDAAAGSSRPGRAPVAPPAGAATVPVVPAEPIVPDYEFHWTPGADPATPAEIQTFFTSPAIEDIKRQMVDMGRRMWEREYTDGNGGNLTVRVGDNLVLCTPTLISKGFMKTEHICLVDMEGRQLAGKYKRTSEVLTHLAVMKAQPKAKACCHAHPPHATAFAVARVQPPTCMIPEAEVFLGEIGLADYRTPGSPENAVEVGRVAKDHMSILMVNHGVITWGKDIEDAYWKMENTDSYCRTIWVATFLGSELSTITGSQAMELIGLRKQLGMTDKREGWKECELCNNDEFRPGVICRIPDPANACATGACPTPPAPERATAAVSEVDAADPAVEQLIQQITNTILAKLG